MNWKYFEPKFEYEEKFEDSSWPWSGHKYFAYDLIVNIKPKVIVELGTHYGTSLWSFSQAVKDQNIDTELNAVDTWEGEKHAGFYGEEVFEKVNDIKNTYYSELKINLIRKTFDEAVSGFKDNSVDILHIDGLHTYEAAKHDFENWLPKLNDKGIIIFHDIKVREGDFGVYKLWEELREKYVAIEFYQSFGLGILFLDKNFGEEIKSKEKEWQMHYSYIHEIKKIHSIRDRDQEIQQKVQEIENKDQIIVSKEQIIEQKVQEIENKDNIAKSKLKEIENKDDIIHSKEQVIEQKVQEIQSKDQDIKEKDSLISLKVQEIQSKNQDIKEKDYEIDSKINELSLIYSSRAWKVILLIRKILNFFIPVGSFRRKIAGRIYKYFKKIIKFIYKMKELFFRILKLIKRGLFVLTKEGIFIFIKKVKKFIIKKLNLNNKSKKYLNNSIIDLNYKPMFLGELRVEHITVVVHLYYTDMWQDIVERLKNIPYEYTLIVSLSEGHFDQSIIKKIYKYKPDTKILVVDNKGMDILPFLKSMKYIPKTTKYLLKIHTKKSPHSPEIGTKWFNNLMDHVLPNKETVDLIIDNLEYTNIGMIGGSNLFDIFRTFTGDEMYESKIEQIYQYFKEEHSSYQWISGTMFWVRYDLISKLNDDKFISFIEKEQPSGYAQSGTIVHGLERYFGKLVYDAGKTISLIPEKIHHKNQIIFNGKNYFLSDNEEYIIVISHDATKTGAPILALNIVKTIKENFKKKVITILLKGGPLEEEFKQYGIVFNLSHISLNTINGNDQEIVNNLLKDLVTAGVTKCICNTVLSGLLMPFLDKYKFSCINLIHEQSETIKKENYIDATEKVLSYANKIVFSSNFVKNDFEKNFQKFEKEIFIRPQGIYLKNNFSNKKEEAHILLREKLGLKNSSKIILGCGSAVLKKGVDLFFEIANQITSKNRELQCYFVWMGEWDELLKIKLLKMAEEKGFLERMILVDFEKDPSIYFAGSDIFLLTSRQDPFPSVVLNAMDCGVPVIAFEKSGGSPEMLINQQGIIVPYLDIKSMGKEVVQLLKNKEHYKIISDNAKNAVKKKFDFEEYVEFILEQLKEKNNDITFQDENINKKVSDFWGSAENTTSRYGIGFHWVESSMVMERINEKISGDKNIDWVSYIINKYLYDMSTYDGLSLGCGSGNLERHLQGRKIFKSLDAIDVSEGAISGAKKLAEEQGLKINYYVDDINNLKLENNKYKVVFFNSSLHHVVNIEHILNEIEKTLTDDGILIINEYVGPSQFQFTEKQTQIINQILDILPVDYRKSVSIQNELKPHHIPPTKEYMDKTDPSEAIRSNEIVSILENKFKVIEKKDFGGTLLHFLLQDIVGNFDSSNPKDTVVLKLIFYIEDSIIDSGILSSDFTFMVMKKK